MFQYQITHTLSTNRLFHLLPQVSSVGFLPHKKDLVNRTFASCNFSFILEGSGTYLFRKKRFHVQAPCVLIQMPGEPMYYYPDGEWAEMFLIYPQDTYFIWNSAGLLNPEKPVWEMKNSNLISAQCETLQKMLQQPVWSGDRLDLICYSMILETWEEEKSQTLEHTMIPAMRKWIEQSLGGKLDCQAFAKKFNMSLSSLRRYWNLYHKTETFLDYRNSFFLRESCRHLSETTLSIKEIAEKLNFHDQFYFSKKFHQLTGMTPLEYRKKTRYSYPFFI